MNLAYPGRPMMAWYVPQNPTTSKVRVSFLKLAAMLKQTGRSIRPTGNAFFLGTTPWKPLSLGWSYALLMLRRSRVSR